MAENALTSSFHQGLGIYQQMPDWYIERLGSNLENADGASEAFAIMRTAIEHTVGYNFESVNSTVLLYFTTNVMIFTVAHKYPDTYPNIYAKLRLAFDTNEDEDVLGMIYAAASNIVPYMSDEEAAGIYQQFMAS
jgi:hypothetical protein